MRLHALVVLAIMLPVGCTTSPEPVGAGYRGIEKAILVAKGME